MPNFSSRRLSSLAGLILGLCLAGCQTTPKDAPRSWVDSGTAVAITAQAGSLVLSREDFPAGVNVRDYVELGAFEINRSGARTRYLAFTLWSTIDRSAEQWARTEADFASVTLWADDQPLLLKRSATTQQGISVSTSVFTLPAPNARQMYYTVTLQQLRTLATARSWTLSPVGMAEGERMFAMWRGDTLGLNGFIAAVTVSDQ